jgi:dolichol-phosphate mannosyltransferase
MMRLLWIVTLVQGILAVRVFFRMARTATGSRIVPVPDQDAHAGTVSVLVPVLNEAHRIEPCLAGLAAQGSAVREVIAVDGGSTDGTVGVIERAARQDPRLRVVDSAPVPAGVNGKAHGLAVAATRMSPETQWVLVMDADVRPAPPLVGALLAKAAAENIQVLSAATRQRLSGPAEAVIHPSMLATLVYRFGIPGHVVHRAEDVQANGQCLLVHRDALAAVGGFDVVLRANAEDVTLVRTLVTAGYPAGFFEAGDLVEVEMYQSWQEAWNGWSRSLPMRDRFSTWRLPVGLAEVVLVQAAPLLLWPVLVVALGPANPLTMVQGGLAIARCGVLAGMRRAYIAPPVTYWLSPFADLPVAYRLIDMARRRRFTWRGRNLETGDRR